MFYITMIIELFLTAVLFFIPVNCIEINLYKQESAVKMLVPLKFLLLTY